jgi:Domain of unknown function (DUF6089)
MPYFSVLTLHLIKRAYILFFLILAFTGISQTRKRNFHDRELGLLLGGSYYIGDINTTGHFKDSHPAIGLFFRYNPNYRYAFRFGFTYGKISGNDAQSSNANQQERNLSFSSNIYEASSIAEFNFVEYRIGHDRYRFTLFIFAGLAGYYFNPIGSGGEELRAQNTENQEKAYPKIQVSVPFGVGLKWNAGDKWGFGVEWGPRRTFTDYLDDIKGSYPKSNADNGDPATTPGSMRGNPNTRDWYFYYGLTINLKLPDPRKACHGAGRRGGRK